MLTSDERDWLEGKGGSVLDLSELEIFLIEVIEVRRKIELQSSEEKEKKIERNRAKPLYPTPSLNPRSVHS